MISSVKLAAAFRFTVIAILAATAYHTKENQKRKVNRSELSYHRAYTAKHS